MFCMEILYDSEAGFIYAVRHAIDAVAEVVVGYNGQRRRDDTKGRVDQCFRDTGCQCYGVG